MRAKIEEKFREGEIVQAYEYCQASLQETPDDVWTQHRAVLSLIKSGALHRARDLFEHYRLDRARHDEDCLTIGARLNKAMALEGPRADLAARARAAADQYADVFDITSGHYPAINAASLYLLAGDRPLSRDWARRVLALRRVARDTGSAEGAYYRSASEAEAHVLLGDVSSARLALAEAISRDPANLLAQATTRRQLKWVCLCLGLDPDWLSWRDAPRPAHFAGHLFNHDMIETEDRLRLQQSLDALFETRPIGPLFGALAAGADIMIAEAALRHGRALHVILPVPVRVFAETSVRPYGQAWVHRMEACLEAAEQVTELTSDRRLISPSNINFAASVAMGLARMRADLLATEPVQILIASEAAETTGTVEETGFGTARDACVWKLEGLEQVRLPVRRKPGGDVLSPLAEPDSGGFPVVMRALIFVDIAGSTSVPDDRVAIFVSRVIGGLVQAIESLEVPPVYRDSWGDGLFLAFADAGAAAEAAVSLQAAFSRIDLAALDLPDGLALRIGGHYGPVHSGTDPLQQRDSLFGAQVAVSARIERSAIPGTTVVSEAFASVLKMESATRFKCEYVGRVSLDTALPETSLFALRAMAPDAVELTFQAGKPLVLQTV